jgi:uncharacterized protein YuzE
MADEIARGDVYVRIGTVERGHSCTDEVAHGVMVDYDQAGNVNGVEVLGADSVEIDGKPAVLRQSYDDQEIDRIDALLNECCRECRAEDKYERADYILWGKLLPKEALGPRCYDHAEKHVGHEAMSRIDQWAVFDLRRCRAALAALRGEQK